MDRYLNDLNVITRLVKAWFDYKDLIVAYDFDDTVFDFHQKGYTYTDVIELLRRCKKIGAHCILFTCNMEDKYDTIRKYLKDNDIPCDFINENSRDIDFQTKKIYYNILLDDKAGLSSAYSCLKMAADTMEQKPETYEMALDILYKLYT